MAANTIQYIVIFGSLSQGITTIHGPFEDKDHANQWVSMWAGNQPYTIQPLNTNLD